MFEMIIPKKQAEYYQEKYKNEKKQHRKVMENESITSKKELEVHIFSLYFVFLLKKEF